MRRSAASSTPPDGAYGSPRITTELKAVNAARILTPSRPRRSGVSFHAASTKATAAVEFLYGSLAATLIGSGTAQAGDGRTAQRSTRRLPGDPPDRRPRPPGRRPCHRAPIRRLSTSTALIGPSQRTRLATDLRKRHQPAQAEPGRQSQARALNPPVRGSSPWRRTTNTAFDLAFYFAEDPLGSLSRSSGHLRGH